MAKAKKISTARAKTTSARVANASYASEPKTFKDLVFQISANPTVRYVAAGLATAVLARFANSISDRYPEISTFLKDNLNMAENKLSDYKSSLADSRH